MVRVLRASIGRDVLVSHPLTQLLLVPTITEGAMTDSDTLRLPLELLLLLVVVT